MTEFLAVYDDADGKRQSWIYNSYNAYQKDIADSKCKEIFILDMSEVNGKTYTEKKEEVRERAIEWSNMMGEAYGLSLGEIKIIDDFFEKYGRRYGLLREFRENCIC